MGEGQQYHKVEMSGVPERGPGSIIHQLLLNAPAEGQITGEGQR